MHSKDDVSVAVGASDLQTVTASGEPSLSPAGASSFPQQSVQPAPLLPHLSHKILHHFPFQIRERVYRYGAKNPYRKM
jgi:hypothetical protein